MAKVATSGKSTLARRYVEDHSLALALDIDVVRGMLGGDWSTHRGGTHARRMAIEMSPARLGSGRDVRIRSFSVG